MSELTPSSHLDDERLSALIDGEATAGEEQHARTCADCSATLAAWRRALGGLAGPAPVVEAAQRDAAIAAALAAAGRRGDAGGGAAAGRGGEAGSGVAASEVAPGEEAPGGVAAGAGADVSMAARDRAAPGGAGVSATEWPAPSVPGTNAGETVAVADPRRWRARVRGPRLTITAAIAAAIVIAGVAVGVWRAGGGGSGNPSAGPTAAVNTVPATGVPGGAARASGGTAGPATAGPNGAAGTSFAGVNLGSYQDPDGLAAALRDRLSPAAAAGGTPASTTPGIPPGASPISPACASEAAGDARLRVGSRPVLSASLTYRGSPAQVFVFPVGSRYTAAVVAVPGCRLLALTAF